jgi:hypothetical protein
MTGSDLIVAAPWIAFGLALLALCVPLLRSRRAARRSRRSERADHDDDTSRRPARR